MSQINASAILDMVNKKGFSLTEMMMTIAIISIMTGAVFVNFSATRKTKGLETEARRLVANIREAQDNAFTGKKPADDVAPCGWGIYYDAGTNPGEYKIYYNVSTSGCSVANGSELDRKFILSGVTLNGTSSVAQTVILENNARFDGLSTDEVYFAVPHGRIFDQNGVAIATPLKLLLRSTVDSTVQHTVCVFSSGRVDDEAGEVDCGTI